MRDDPLQKLFFEYITDLLAFDDEQYAYKRLIEKLGKLIADESTYAEEIPK